MFSRVRNFLTDESGVSGVVVTMALIVIGALTTYYLYNGIKPGVVSVGGNIGKVLQQQ